MRLLQIVAPEHVIFVERPTPEPGPGEVLIRVLAVTTCPHWDMHIMSGTPMFSGGTLLYPYTPGQPGHEACGEIVSVGDGVTEYATGDRVCVWRDPGHDVLGGYADYMIRPVSDVIAVPKELPPPACAPLELAMCASAHMPIAEQLGAIRGGRVGVWGLGAAGLAFVQLARAAGAAEVVGIDPIAARRTCALQLGANEVVEPRNAAFVRGRFTCAFDCVGHPAAVHQAMDATTRLVVLFAVQREPYVRQPANWAGLVVAGAQPHTREAAEHAAQLLRAGTLDLQPLVTHCMPLSEYTQAVGLLRSQEAIKVALIP